MILPRERIEAVLLAGAEGDGIGAAAEGELADPERRLAPPPWRVSDDTRLTFATCRGIATGSIDPAAIANELLKEFHAGLPALRCGGDPHLPTDEARHLSASLVRRGEGR